MSQDTCMASASCIVTWALGTESYLSSAFQRYVTDVQWDVWNIYGKYMEIYGNKWENIWKLNSTQLALYHGKYMEKRMSQY